jgi:hypothetical protein
MISRIDQTRSGLERIQSLAHARRPTQKGPFRVYPSDEWAAGYMFAMSTIRAAATAELRRLSELPEEIESGS